MKYEHSRVMAHSTGSASLKLPVAPHTNINPAWTLSSGHAVAAIMVNLQGKEKDVLDTRRNS